jgi:GNAT superfamily N-acetyltransferase
MTTLTIREATVDDAATVATLFSEFNALLGVDGIPEEDAYNPALFEVTEARMSRRLQAMAGIEHVLLAEAGGDHAGLCCLRLIPYIGQDVPYAEVTQLYVRPQSQRHGVGAALLRAAEARAQAQGCTCVHIITGRQNANARAFYTAQGYRNDDVVFDKYFTDQATSRPLPQPTAATPTVGSQHAGTLRLDGEAASPERQGSNA